MIQVLSQIAACTLCAERFSATITAHAPRPVLRAHRDARLLIAGQAPGLRVHQSGLPFNDPSGDRLRDWMGVSRNQFYDERKIAIVPMGFCFPGYNAHKADLPPPKLCAQTWRNTVLDQLPNIELSLIIGGHAQNWHFGPGSSVTDRVKDWRRFAPQDFPLPHPSWRNSAWLRQNPWFAQKLLPQLRECVTQTLR